MVAIPPEVTIPLTIEQGSIYHYHVEITRKDGSIYKGERFFIVLNVNPRTDAVLILTTITSQIANQQRYIQNIQEDPSTLVAITKADFSSLTKDSVVNCNNTYETTQAELIGKINAGGKIFFHKLPRNIISALIQGTLISKQVPQERKKRLI